ncbi:MAG: ribonuclease D [Phycisphaerae bacterium]
MNAPPTIKPELITDAAGLKSLRDRLQAAGWFAFDTEFVGEDQFLPEICLIQVATEDLCALVDPLNGLETRPFWELIADEAVQILVHAGAEDVAHCMRLVGQPPRNVFDLQIAAGLVGQEYPISLSRLAKKTVGRRIHKSQTLTNWRKRPLTPEQIRYAVEDVACLRPMYDFLYKRLESTRRLTWAQQECEALCAAASAEEQNVQLQLKRLKGSGSLSGLQLAIAHALLDAREELARAYNRPARTVLRDHLVVEIARRGWSDVKQIRTLRGLSLKSAAITRLAQAVEAARRLPREQWPEIPTREDSPEEEVLLSLATAVLRDHCAKENLAYSLLCKKQELRALVRSHTRPEAPKQPPSAFDHGWRKEAVGDLLDDVLTGRRAVRVAGVRTPPGLVVE